jgi:tetratricopeptide (TPR) repeat protein
MGFGIKTDFETGRKLDLDKSYHNVIKPAVEEAGLKCVRADEIVHSGLIDVPMYEQLLNADVVIADLSTSNRNAFYELGVRHALRPRTTIIIAEDGIKPPFPFDLNHVAIRQYHHMGEDIGYTDTMNFRAELKKAITTILALENSPPDSPVYTFLDGLTVTTKHGADAAAADAPPAPAAAGSGEATLSSKMKVVDDAQRAGKFDEAKKALEKILAETRAKAEELKKAAEQARSQNPVANELMPPQPKYRDDPTLIQRLALVTYKNNAAPVIERCEEARNLLATLEPRTSNDTETLGLWGAVHKRLWDETKVRAHLDEAVRAYERGFYLRNDYYNGINFAFLLNVRAKESEAPAEAIADFIQAQRVRREVLSICDQWLIDNPAPDEEKVSAKALKEYLTSKYWVLATRAEALLGTGATNEAEQAYQEAYAMAPASWMVDDSTKPQRAALEPLLADSPLQHLKS